MRLSASLLLPLCLCIPLGAQQGPDVITTTDYGVLALDSQNTDHDAVAPRTAIARSLVLNARVGRNRDAAMASTAVTRVGDPRLGLGVSLREHGMVASDNPNGGGAAGTSDSAPGARQPNLGGHSLRVAYAVTAGNTGKIHILFGGNASAGARGGVSIDVDGDGQADFAARAGGQQQHVELPVTAGRPGVVVDIFSVGQALLRGRGHENYDFRVAVFFIEDVTGPTCGFRAFGRACGAQLDGTLVRTPRGPGAQLDVSQGTPGAYGIMIIGDPLRTPIGLPGTRCSLLVDFMGPKDFFRLDRAGAAQRIYGIPPHRGGFEIGFQTLILALDPQAGIVLTTTNGQKLACR